MTSALDEIPSGLTGAGHSFSYSNWTEGTVATLVNVPWNNDYRDVVRFAGQSALDTWIDSQETVVVDRMSLAKFSLNVRINTPFNAAIRYNYLRVENPTMPVTG